MKTEHQKEPRKKNPEKDLNEFEWQKELEDLNKSVVQRYWEGKWNERRIGILDDLQSKEVVYHGTSMKMNGIEEYRHSYQRYLNAFHHTRITVEELIAEGDRVMSRVRLQGVHQGELEGLPATGKKFSIIAFTVFRLYKGKIEEEWEMIDELGLMQQLGMELLPGEAVH
jgi:steroid delta-isomerase-like uncharacterized protein